MATCEGRDTNVNLYSTISAATTTATSAGDGCAAAEAGKDACPEGWCRCSGRWRRRVERPWGSGKPCSFGPNVPAGLEVAKQRRGKMRKSVIAMLTPLVQALAANADALAADEELRATELKDWLARLQAET